MRQILAIIVGLLPIQFAHSQATKEADRIKRWEKDIAAIEERQMQKPPVKGGIIFAGSSTIRLWDLAKSFPDRKFENTGFGGSEIRDVTHFAPRIILKHEPRAIVFYAGDNDVNSKRKPEQVLADYRKFVDSVHKELPETRILYLAIKPSLARWDQFDTQAKANALVKEFCAKNDRLGYIDIVTPILGKDGKPTPELFVKDGLHLSPKGYALLNDAVRVALK